MENPTSAAACICRRAQSRTQTPYVQAAQAMADSAATRMRPQDVSDQGHAALGGQPRLQVRRIQVVVYHS